jgi:hypothetical protein
MGKQEEEGETLYIGSFQSSRVAATLPDISSRVSEEALAAPQRLFMYVTGCAAVDKGFAAVL